MIKKKFIINGMEIEFEGDNETYNTLSPILKTCFDNFEFVDVLMEYCDISHEEFEKLFEEEKEPIYPVYIYIRPLEKILEEFHDEEILESLEEEHSIGFQRNLDWFPEIPVEIFIPLDHPSYKDLVGKGEKEAEILKTIIHKQLEALGEPYLRALALDYKLATIPELKEIFKTKAEREILKDDITQIILENECYIEPEDKRKLRRRVARLKLKKALRKKEEKSPDG